MKRLFGAVLAVALLALALWNARPVDRGIPLGASDGAETRDQAAAASVGPKLDRNAAFASEGASDIERLYSARGWDDLVKASVPAELAHDRHTALLMASSLCRLDAAARRGESRLLEPVARTESGRLSLALVADFSAAFCEGFSANEAEALTRDAPVPSFSRYRNSPDVLALLADERSPAIFATAIAEASQRALVPDWEDANGFPALDRDRQVKVRRLAGLEVACRRTPSMCAPASLVTFNDCKPDLCRPGASLQNVVVRRWRLSEPEQRLAMQLALQIERRLAQTP